MLKKIFLLIILSSILIAQNVEIKRIQTIAIEGEIEFSYPKFIDENKLLLTTPNFKGLWIYDLTNKKLVQLNDHFGSGYEPIAFDGGKRVAFRMDEFVDRKKVSSIIVQNVENKNESYLISRQRNLGTPKLLPDGTLFFYQNENPYTVSKIFNVEADFIPTEAVEVFIDNTNLVIVAGGESKIINPLGENINYIWPAVSPQQDKILFTAAGKGTYICDLEGKLISEIGYANYPSWSDDGKWIAFMKDKDDGHQIVKSDIYIWNVETGKEIQITNSADKIEMYPAWSKDNKRLIYSTLGGKIEIIYLKFDK